MGPGNRWYKYPLTSTIVSSELVSQYFPCLQTLKMLFIKHFFTFIFAFLVFGSTGMALTMEEIVEGKVYMGHQDGLTPLVPMVHVLLFIL
jgi:hypothetical protein